MGNNTRVGLAALVAAPFIGVMATGAAIAEPQTCTVNTARVAANEGDFDTLCSCSQVTRGFVSHLQNRSDFASILQNTSAQCPGLTQLLSDLPTASISNTNAGEERSRDPSSNSVGSSENGSSGNGGGSSGNSDGSSGGNGDPGDGGSSPGDGGGKGGGKGGHGGGDKPGKGGGKGGHGGGDKPGKGGDKGGHGGGDKPGKGGGKGGNDGGDKPGKGGAKGNNGGGNGPEGASPGRGKNANNDER